MSFEKLDLGAFCNLLLPFALLGFSVTKLERVLTPMDVLLYCTLILLAVAFFYSLMLVFASTSVWLGRNQGLYEFWFYITIFARYPRDIYTGSLAADALRMGFTFVVPILLVVTVPAEVLVGKPFTPFWLLVMAVAAVVALIVSRKVFHLALRSYRSASS